MKKTTTLITSILTTATALSGIILTSSNTSADGDSAVSNASVTVPVSCIMSSTVDVDHNATLSPGTYSGASGSQYENGIGKTTLTTYCNDRNGYVVYAIGSSNNELGNNKLVSNINDNLNNYDIASGTATSGTTSNTLARSFVISFAPRGITDTNCNSPSI